MPMNFLFSGGQSEIRAGKKTLLYVIERRNSAQDEPAVLYSFYPPAEHGYGRFFAG
jgi:hypothetical protein